MADPGAALSETRRVLRPGGRAALAAWAAPEDNVWASAAVEELVRCGLTEPLPPDVPTMFSIAPPGRIEELLEGAGFQDVVVESVSFDQRYDSFAGWWETSLDLSAPFAEAVEAADEARVSALRAALQERLAAYRRDDGSLTIPARTFVAVARA
jgi:SAM-dependent methyltransferase